MNMFEQLIRFRNRVKLRAKILAGYRKRRFYNNSRIFHDHKCVFIHIPKTAGNSITRALSSLPETGTALSPRISKHAKAWEVKALLGKEIWNDYFTFSFVRNPWDLMVSSYHWWQQKAAKYPYHKRKARKVRAMDNFDRFIRSRFGSYMINERYGCEFDWIAENGSVIVDYVGKVETIERDWQRICERLGIESIPLPFINRSKRKDYREYYTPETQRMIEQRFRKTIDQFGYTFD